MSRHVIVAVALTVGLLCVLGCGRESRHDVGESVMQLASISAEGALMADDVVRGRTKTTFVRVHGEELSAQAQHEAEKLNDDPITADLTARVQTAIKLASQIGGAIDDVRTSPQDLGQVRSARAKLRRWSAQASKIAASI